MSVSALVSVSMFVSMSCFYSCSRSCSYVDFGIGISMAMDNFYAYLLPEKFTDNFEKLLLPADIFQR
jgi:hypothetical protein